MILEQTHLPGLTVITPHIYSDERGYFSEIYKNDILKHFHCLQENESLSIKNVLRGLHLQKNPFAQNKLVRCVWGEILDVAVDFRPESPTFLKHFKVRLSQENKKQLFIPKGFAHGFLTMSDIAIVSYKVDAHYHPDSEMTLRFDDPALGINWELSAPAILSEKDSNAPLLKL